MGLVGQLEKTNMRISVVVTILLAFILAAATAFVAKRYVDRGRPAQMVSELGSSAGSEQILVAARDIAVGTVLLSSDLKYEPWPKSLIPSTAIRRPDNGTTAAKLEGMVARRSFVVGEPMSMTAVFSPENSGMVAGILRPGMRAVSINVSPPSGVAGLAMPGDRVDVILVADFAKIIEKDPKAAHQNVIEKFAAETVLEDVRVLGVDQKFSRAKGDAPVLGKTVTLEISPRQAEKLAAVTMLGQLSLSLRSYAIPPISEATGFTADTEASAVLGKLVRPKTDRSKQARIFEDPAQPQYSVRVTRGGQSTSQAAATSGPANQ